MKLNERQQSSRSTALRSGVRASILSVIVGLAASSVLAESTAMRYPEYDIVATCRSEMNSGLMKRRHDCEDREYAVAIALRTQWHALERAQPELIEACVVLNNTFDASPSYLSLLQCITRVRNAAD